MALALAWGHAQGCREHVVMLSFRTWCSHIRVASLPECPSWGVGRFASWLAIANKRGSERRMPGGPVCWRELRRQAQAVFPLSSAAILFECDALSTLLLPAGQLAYFWGSQSNRFAPCESIATMVGSSFT